MTTGFLLGEVVRVVDGRGWFLGKAFYSSTSKISLRWMSFEDVEVGPALFGARIAQADALRRSLYPGKTTYRAVHGEADLLPGLVVDRYGDVLSIQFLVQATEARNGVLATMLLLAVVAVIMLITLGGLLAAETVQGWLGHTGMSVVVRILGILLAAVSAEMILTGLRDSGIFSHLR